MGVYGLMKLKELDGISLVPMIEGTGRAEHEYLHITGIPIDELSNEAIVLEIEIEEN